MPSLLVESVAGNSRLCCDAQYQGSTVSIECPNMRIVSTEIPTSGKLAHPDVVYIDRIGVSASLHPSVRTANHSGT